MIIRFPLLLILALALGPGLCVSPAATAQPDAGRYMPVEEIRPGMRGTGRTVFQGSDIEEFEVEILGVLRTAAPRGDMILARLSGHGLEESGVIAGMSGSPIYIEGRLIGALAYGWSFTTEPITGITPIADMLHLESRGGGQPPGDENSGRSLDRETWHDLLAHRGEEAWRILQDAAGPARAEPGPLQVPVCVTGLGEAANVEAARLLEPHGFLAVPGGTAGEDSLDAADLQPGSAVGVELVRGDAHIAAIGTLTWREGDRILAFGHRMMHRGAVAYPLTAASIITVLPRLSSSMKMGVVGEPVGTITHDYRAGVAGRLGPAPAMIPMTMDLEFGDRSESLAFEILDAPMLTPALAGAVAMSGLQSLGRESGAATVRVRTRVSLADGRSVETEALLAGFTPPVFVAGEVARLVGLLDGNPFELVRIDGIAVQARVEPAIEAAFLETVAVGPGPHRAGDAVPVTLWFRDYRGSAWRHEVVLELPRALAPGDYRVRVCDAQADGRAESDRAPGRYRPRSLDGLISLLAEEPTLDQITVRLLRPQGNAVVRGQELPNLPSSLRATLGSPLVAGRASGTAGAVVVVEHTRLGKMLLGCRDLPLTVEPSR